MDNYPVIHVNFKSDVLIEELDNEAVLLNSKSEHYFGLDESGVRFWKLLEQNGNSADTVKSLLSEYNIDEPTLQKDVAKFIIELDQAGLLEIKKSEA